MNLYLSNSNPTSHAPLGSPIDGHADDQQYTPLRPRSRRMSALVHATHSRRVTGFRLQFSQAMDPTSAQNLANYEVLLPPAHKNGQARHVSLSQAVLDPSGHFVTLTRANLQPAPDEAREDHRPGPAHHRVLSTSGTFLAGTRGVSGTDASLTVSI